MAEQTEQLVQALIMARADLDRARRRLIDALGLPGSTIDLAKIMLDVAIVVNGQVAMLDLMLGEL